jgi:hypothetical protein
MAPHAPNTSESGGLISVNGSTFCTIFGMRMGAEFLDGKTLRARVRLPEVRNGEQETASQRGKMAKAITFGVFGQIRCRKSPARGFWTF